MKKSPDAFRTISEVAEWLDVPTHVLRFWESRFAQIKPVKRAGGRRYYRPSDMRLIGGVKVLLHDQGMTIRSVQKMLREQGIKHISSFSPLLDGEEHAPEVIEQKPVAEDAPPAAPAAAARSTHGATPAPVDNAGEPDAADAPDDGQADMFPDHVAAAVPDLEETATPDDPPPADPAEDDVLPEEAAAKGPLGTDLPITDPEDTSEVHLTGPGIAGRLALAKADDLAAHRETLKTARDALAALRDKAS